MLTSYIIEEIKRREQETELREELFIECPLPDSHQEIPVPTPCDDIVENNTIVVLDLDI